MSSDLDWYEQQATRHRTQRLVEQAALEAQYQAERERHAAAHDARLRTALLQRLANGLAIARLLADGADEEGEPLWDESGNWYDDEHHFYWPCCWLTYEWHYWLGRSRLPVQHRLCAEDCPHWHHQREAVIALA